MDVLGFYVYGGGEVAFLEIDEDVLEFAAALAHEASFEAVEASTDDAYSLAV